MSVAMRNSAPGLMTSAKPSRKGFDTRRRLAWRVLGQGSGKRMKAFDRRRGRKRAKKRADVVGVEADVAQSPLLDGRQRLDDTVFERFAADQADIRVGARLMDQVLSTAEAHLQPDFGDGGGKELGQWAAGGVLRGPGGGAAVRRPSSDVGADWAFGCACGRKSAGHFRGVFRSRRSWHSVWHSVRRLEKKTAAELSFHGRSPISNRDQTAALILSARSVRSQEKPPSASGARPKWP